LSPGDFIGRWMNLLKPAAEQILNNDLLTAGERQRALERVSIRNSLANLRTFPCVKILEDKGKLQLHGAWFDISTGELWIMDTKSGDFLRPNESLPGSSAYHHVHASVLQPQCWLDPQVKPEDDGVWEILLSNAYDWRRGKILGVPLVGRALALYWQPQSQLSPPYLPAGNRLSPSAFSPGSSTGSTRGSMRHPPNVPHATKIRSPVPRTADEIMPQESAYQPPSISAPMMAMACW
jgi:hypothetical protein